MCLTGGEFRVSGFGCVGQDPCWFRHPEADGPAPPHSYAEKGCPEAQKGYAELSCPGATT